MRAAPFALAVFVVAGCASPREEAPPPAGGSPRALLDWSFIDTEGVAHSRDAPPGNATVLFFMATWCGSCRAKAPILAQAHDEHAGRGVRFYSIDFDPSETPADIAAWKARYAQDWPHGVDPDLRIQRTFNVRTQSSVVVLDARGSVVGSWGYGQVSEPALRDAIGRALAADSASAS